MKFWGQNIIHRSLTALLPTTPPALLGLLTLHKKRAVGFIFLISSQSFSLFTISRIFEVIVIQAEPIAMTLDFTSLTPWTWAFYAAHALLVAIICYRRFFHPLHAVPGPLLPAVTRLYLWYHNIFKDGTYYKKIDEMHAKYGTKFHCILLVSPN